LYAFSHVNRETLTEVRKQRISSVESVYPWGSLETASELGSKKRAAEPVSLALPSRRYKARQVRVSAGLP
jgi:hypothetical protein